MKLDDMMVFATVVDSGSFTAAAEQLGLPTSNISRKLTRLEEALGVKLLERTTRSMRLTEIGQIYYQHCQRIQDEVKSAQRCTENLLSKPQGRLTVSSSLSVGQGLLAPQLSAFKQQYPEIIFELQLSNRRVDLIEEGFDIIIRVGPSADSSLMSKYLCTSKLSLYASTEYLQAHGTPTNLSNLTDHQCLFMSGANEKPAWPLRQISKQHSNLPEQSLAITPTMTCDDFSVLKQLSLDHAGIALLPDYMVASNAITGNLQKVLPDEIGRSVDIFAIYASRKGITPKTRVFLDYMQEALV